MVECELCGKGLKKEWAVSLSETSARNHVGPLYFCNDDHRETWRHEHADEDEFGIAGIDTETAGDVDYGQWSE